MSFIQDLADRYLFNPFAKRVLTSVKQQTPNEPVAFGVPIGFNTSNMDTNRKQGGSNVSYQTLREISINHETVRAAINARKRQITQLKWEIIDVNPNKNTNYTDEERSKIKEIINHIGGSSVRFREILDKIMEDVLVLDALCFYKQKTVGGKLLRIIPIDGATIKLRIDESGFLPLPPEYAFEQWIKGVKVAEMTTEEMVFERMNPRTNSPYGLSPLESLLVTVDASLRASLYNTSYLSDNNIPQGFLSLPEAWTVQQIKDYKEFFDAMVSGPKEQAKIYPIPGGSQYQATSKPNDFQFKDFFDYLDRKIAMVFDITPQELGLSLQQYKENAEGQDKIQVRKGIKPLAHFLEEILTDLIRNDLGYEDLAFTFTGLESRFGNVDIQSQIPLGVLGIDEVREDMGLPKLGVEPFVLAGNQITLVSQIGKVQTTVSGQQTTPTEPTTPPTKPQEPTPTEEMTSEKVTKISELKAWENKAIKDFKKKGKVYRGFESDLLEKSLKVITQNRLERVESIEDIKSLFNKIRNERVNPIEKAITSDKTKLFKNSVKEALLKQIEPFTKEELINKLTETKKDFNEDITLNLDELFDSIEIEGLGEFLKWAAQSGGQSAYEDLGLGSTFKLTSKDFQRMLGDRENYLITSLDSTTKDWLIRTITEGKRNALTNAEIARSISDESETISSSRADTIVNTEVANAMQTAELDTYREQGIARKVWVTSEDELTCDECSPLDGQIAKVDDAFDTGDDAPPIHPNCRCYIQAVIE